MGYNPWGHTESDKTEATAAASILGVGIRFKSLYFIHKSPY